VASVTLRRVSSLELNVVMDEKGGLIADWHSILARRRIQFSQLLNEYGVIYVRQTEIHTYINTYIHTSEPLLAVPSAFEVKMAFLFFF